MDPEVLAEYERARDALEAAGHRLAQAEAAEHAAREEWHMAKRAFVGALMRAWWSGPKPPDADGCFRFTGGAPGATGEPPAGSVRLMFGGVVPEAKP